MATTPNLNAIGNWTSEMAPVIAKQFGYVLNEGFVTAVDEYRRSIEGATILDYISLLGERFLKEHQPPLDKQARK